MTEALISAADAIRQHDKGESLFLDATWTIPGGPKPRVDGYIPGAIRFDIDTVKDDLNPLPHMLPQPMAFGRHMDDLGIGNETDVIVYDRLGIFSGPRVWWMLKSMGHDRVQVLDGGLPAWIEAGGKTAESPSKPKPAKAGTFQATPSIERVANRYAVTHAMQDGTAHIVDARPQDRFDGGMPEPRAGMRSGHIPGSHCLPFTRFWNENGTFNRDIDALDSAGIDTSKPVITTCGSGVSAAILAMAFERQGIVAALYDGSWAEWGSRTDTPIETASQRKGGA